MATAPPVIDPAVARQAQGHRGIALGWAKRGRIKQAIAGLEKALELDPTCLDIYLDYARLLLQLRRWDDLVILCRRGLAYLIEASELHKLLITAVEERSSWEDACAVYGLERRDQRPIAIADDAILCCLAARNERPRLAYFLRYYRALGVDRFFIIDNGSTDGSVEWLLEQPDVHLWSSELSFKRANFGSSWFELLLRRYGVGHWCLTVDADEFLFYDGSPDRSLKQFCRNLERRNKRAATGLLLDLYGDRPIRETVYHEGDDPLALCPYFDRNPFHRHWDSGGIYLNQDVFFGGVRQRLFPVEHDYLLSKAVLLHYLPDVVLTSGQHFTNIPGAHLAREEVCVLHFKFFASFVEYARVEAQREIHAMGAEQYKGYHQGLERERDLCPYDPALSVRFIGAPQLRELGIMREEEPEPAVHQPRIEALPLAATERPFWSVLISVYDRIDNLERVLSSVLQQADDDMQLEVVCDFSDSDMQQRIGAEVARIGGERVGLHTLPQRLGHPHIFNRCIERARGRWVHILHDDDWVEPGFYHALRQGIEATPGVGAAFCRHRIVSQGSADPVGWSSWQERETPGVIDDWLARIARECRVQFSAMTVRRDVYEALGGFSADAESAFDWEMWIRIAAHYPVYYVPEMLVGVGRDGSAESSRLLRSGEQVAHALRAIDVAARHLPADQAAAMVAKSRERIAIYALDVARQYRSRGNSAAALANLSAAVAVPPSAATLRRIVEFLRAEDHDFKG